MFESINTIAVLVSAILAVSVGSIWYSPLFFGTAWIKASGLPPEHADFSRKEIIRLTAVGVVVQFIFFSVIAQLITLKDMGGFSLLKIGGLLAILIVARMLIPIIWEKRPLAYFLINAGYSVVILFGGLGIIAYWPW